MDMFKRIHKAVSIYRTVALPELSSRPDVPTICGKTAYLCLDRQCQALMERAPQGRCERCGQSCIVPVQGLLQLIRQKNKLLASLATEKVPAAESGAQQAMADNAAAYLTEFRK